MHAAKSLLVLVAGMLLAFVPRAGSAQGAENGRMGAYILLGGGATGFTNSDVKDRFDTGGTWHARLGVGLHSYLGAEVSYVGSMHRGVGVPRLMANGAEGVIRLQYPVVSANMLFEPFAFGGIGWSHLKLKEAIAPGLKDSDNIGVVPYGAGITLGFSRFLLEARFTYRSTFNNDLSLGSIGVPKNYNQWDVGGSIGFEF